MPHVRHDGESRGMFRKAPGRGGIRIDRRRLPAAPGIPASRRVGGADPKARRRQDRQGRRAWRGDHRSPFLETPSVPQRKRAIGDRPSTPVPFSFTGGRSAGDNLETQRLRHRKRSIGDRPSNRAYPVRAPIGPKVRSPVCRSSDRMFRRLIGRCGSVPGKRSALQSKRRSPCSSTSCRPLARENCTASSRLAKRSARMNLWVFGVPSTSFSMTPAVWYWPASL